MQWHKWSIKQAAKACHSMVQNLQCMSDRFSLGIAAARADRQVMAQRAQQWHSGHSGGSQRKLPLLQSYPADSAEVGAGTECIDASYDARSLQFQVLISTMV